MCVTVRNEGVLFFLRMAREEGGGSLAPLQPSDGLIRAGEGDGGKGLKADDAREGGKLVPLSRMQKNNRPRFLWDQSVLEEESGSKTDDKCKTQ